MIRLGIVGAGLIGKRHIAAIAHVPQATLSAVCDPHAEQIAGLPWVGDYDSLLQAVDGVILAVPNDLHAAMTLKAIAAKVPVLVEKPLASTAAQGAQMVAAADAANIPLLVGHHRRHNPFIADAKALIASGALGQLTTVHGQCWLPKPDGYFDVTWRQTKGAGPLFINLIHDVDLLMHLCGPIVQVQAMQSAAVRNTPVEETVVATLLFENGMLGTINLSDAAVGPWSWELTAKENPAYPATDATCYWIGGTKGALTLPDFTKWDQDDGPDWWAPISATRSPHSRTDPLHAQIAHFCDVIAGGSAPLVSGADGLRALRVVEAIKQAAETGQSLCVDGA